ncbi:MAG: Rrf2 family transcriptional regulator [Elusimicrobia bacterium]|nr:Rrf2 family transcriptional regulator [Elusimicrobiota bacterium]MDA8242945.1 Rrf2 family transcriptional regulator [Elusimicrobiota bacterium]
MIYSRTSEYAVRALSWLAARKGGSPAGAREISGGAGIPSAYAAKLLRALAAGGVLKSSYGRAGGFSFRRPPSKISLLDVVDAVEDRKRSPLYGCVMGFRDCGCGGSCPLHGAWAKAKAGILRELGRTMITDPGNMRGLFKSGKKSRKILSREVRDVFDKNK